MRHGHPEAIFDGAGGRVIWYRFNDLQVTHEYLDQGFYGNSSGQYRTLVRTYDSLGRLGTYDTRWSSSGSANFQSATYRYDSVTGRVDRVTGTRVGISTRTFDYQYRANSDLVAAVIGADSGSGFRRDISHSTWRELVDTAATTWSSADRARFVYDHDSAGKRTGQKINGDVAVALGYGSEIQNWYHFTQRGEIDWTEAIRNDNGTSISDRYRDWYYDSQGNRDGEYNQSGHKDFEPWTANEYKSIASIQRTYDADGNLTNDGVWWYYWDGENRLKTAQKQDWSKRLEFAYDFQGRRVRKVVKNGDINAAVASDRRYIYDGWNIVAEIDALNTGAAMQVVKTFTWGLDVTNTVHGGGGVGGLLAIHGNSDCLLPLYDANGNVHGLIDGYSGTMKAAYAFSAFGETLQAINLNGGSAANDNPIRFASKWLDVESGLYDYNCRVYSPMEGRFISRDPIQENGGLNLYAYCGSDPSTHWDYIGQSWLSKTFKKIGNWIKKNWTSIVGAALNFIPGVGPMLSIAWNAAIGYKYGGLKGLAIGFASGYIGARIGGPLAKFGTGRLGVGGMSQYVITQSAVGGVSGGIAASLQGRSFWDGFKAGAITSGVIGSGVYGVRLAQGYADFGSKEWREIKGDEFVHRDLTSTERANFVHAMVDLRVNGGSLGSALYRQLRDSDSRFVYAPNQIPQGWAPNNTVDFPHYTMLALDPRYSSMYSPEAIDNYLAEHPKVSRQEILAQLSSRGALLIGHESGHGVFMLSDEGNNDHPGHNVQAVENPLRAAFGMPMREFYGKTPVPAIADPSILMLINQFVNGTGTWGQGPWPRNPESPIR
jgi:RHS repeat-associated protein